MEASIWTTSLAEFRDRLAGGEPMPGGVALSAVTASFGLNLLMKLLGIAIKRKEFAGDSRKVEAWIENAREHAAALADTVDRDIACFYRYLDSKDNALETVAIPMHAARAAVSGLELCVEAAAIIPAPVAADLGVVVSLLSSALNGILLCVDSNLRRMLSDDSGQELREERQRLEQRAQELVGLTRRALVSLT